MDLQDKIIQPKGNVSIQLIKDDKILKEFEDHNTIVNRASEFMAARMAPIRKVVSGTTYGQRVKRLEPDTNDSIEEARAKTYDTGSTYPLAGGFQYLAIGDGIVNKYETVLQPNYIMNATTDPAHTLDLLLEQKQLYHEYYRQLINQWYFVTEDDTPSENEPTERLRLCTLIDVTGAGLDNKYICELGLFGGNATDTANSGYMFNIKIIDGWKLIPESKLLVNWTITF